MYFICGLVESDNGLKQTNGIAINLHAARAKKNIFKFKKATN